MKGSQPNDGGYAEVEFGSRKILLQRFEMPIEYGSGGSLQELTRQGDRAGALQLWVLSQGATDHAKRKSGGACACGIKTLRPITVELE